MQEITGYIFWCKEKNKPLYDYGGKALQVRLRKPSKDQINQKAYNHNRLKGEVSLMEVTVNIKVVSNE